MKYFLIFLGIFNIIPGLYNNPNMPIGQKIFHLVFGFFLVIVGYLMIPNNLIEKYLRHKEEEKFKKERDDFFNKKNK